MVQTVSFQSLKERKEEIHSIVDLLEKGAVIGYPTETVYGLGGDALNDSVIQKISDLKGRTSQKPFIILLRNAKDVTKFTDRISPEAEKCMRHFWPGPCTLIFSVSSTLLPVSIQKDNKIGIRVSPDPVCQLLTEHFPNPLVSTSANPENKAPSKSAEDVTNYFQRGVDCIIDDGERRQNSPSTILDVAESPPRLIRKGAISENTLRQLLGAIHVT